MIYDKLSNLGLYKGMNPNLDTAIDYILSHDLNELPLGKTVVDGDNVYVNVMDAKASPVEPVIVPKWKWMNTTKKKM